MTSKKDNDPKVLDTLDKSEVMVYDKGTVNKYLVSSEEKQVPIMLYTDYWYELVSALERLQELAQKHPTYGVRKSYGDIIQITFDSHSRRTCIMHLRSREHEDMNRTEIITYDLLLQMMRSSS